MKNKTILYLEKMGCDFFYGDEIEKVSDLNNYRYYIHNIELKDGKKLNTLEVSRGARYQQTAKGLNHIDDFGCWFHTYYIDNGGACWGLIDIDKELNKGNYNSENFYTKETILKLVNSISKVQYTNIKYIERY